MHEWIFLPCKPFSSPFAEMEKLRELRVLCGKKKILKGSTERTQKRAGEQNQRCRRQVCILDLFNHGAHEAHEDVASAERNDMLWGREKLCVLCFSAREKKKKRLPRKDAEAAKGKRMFNLMTIRCLSILVLFVAVSVFGGSEPIPENPAALYNKGNFLCREGDWKGAVECYSQALEVMPVDSGASWRELCARINYNMATAELKLALASPVGERLALLRNAVEIFRRLLLDKNMTSQSAKNLEIALMELSRARQAASKPPSGKQGKKNDDNQSDSSDESDENSEDDSQDGSQQPKTAARYIIDQENQSIPPPTESPEDILKQADAIAEKRKSAKHGKQKGATEMDW